MRRARPGGYSGDGCRHSRLAVHRRAPGSAVANVTRTAPMKASSSPATVERFTLDGGHTVDIPIINMTFAAWNGELDRDSYGGKQFVAVNGEPLFAELAILRHYERDGWSGVWVDSYRRKYRIVMPDRGNPVDLLPMHRELFERIRLSTGRHGGCWDIFLWRDDSILFLESKRRSRDRMQPSQAAWLQAALNLGVPVESFRVISWALEPSHE